MQFLEHYKLELARRRFGPATAEKGGAAAGEEPPAKKPRIDLDKKYSGESQTSTLGTFQYAFQDTCGSLGTLIEHAFLLIGFSVSNQLLACLLKHVLTGSPSVFQGPVLSQVAFSTTRLQPCSIASAKTPACFWIVSTKPLAHSHTH